MSPATGIPSLRRILVAAGLALLLATAGLASPAPSVALTSRGYMVSLTELRARMSLARQGRAPYRAAVDQLLAAARLALTATPRPRNPLDITSTSDVFLIDAQRAYALGLAYGLTGNVTYAAKARTYVIAWARTATVLRNACPTGSCKTSLIVSRAAPDFVFAADLIRPSGWWSSADETLFRGWLRRTILPAASLRTNNWGDHGTLLRVVATDYLGDLAGYRSAIARWKYLVNLTASDGHIPEETRRGASGLNYTQDALDARLAVARISQRRGVDLFTYGRLRLSVDYIARFVLHPNAWPWGRGADATIHPLWEVAYQRWRSAAYAPIVVARRPNGVSHSAVRWTTLTNGIPLQ